MNTVKNIHTHTHTYDVDRIPIFAKLYEFYKNLDHILSIFPKSNRYTLGQKLDALTLHILELLLSTTENQNKILILQQISIKLDLLKILLRLSKDVKSISEKNYLSAQELLQEIGRMLGGWIKSQNAKTI